VVGLTIGSTGKILEPGCTRIYLELGSIRTCLDSGSIVVAWAIWANLEPDVHGSWPGACANGYWSDKAAILVAGSIGFSGILYYGVCLVLGLFWILG
jgi:hypothetical protein